MSPYINQSWQKAINCSDLNIAYIFSTSLVPVLFREVFSHPYISLFHLLVNGFSVIHKDLTDLLDLTKIDNQCCASSNESMKAVSNRWTGLLEWTLTFVLFFFFFPRANYIH